MEIKVSTLGNNYKDVSIMYALKKKKKEGNKDMKPNGKAFQMVTKLLPLLQSQENYFKASDLWSKSLSLIT